MTGIHYLLSVTPTWITVLFLYLVCIRALHEIRERFEGMAYNVSYSSEYGDLALISAVALSIEILKRSDVQEEWIRSPLLQVGGAVIAIIVGYRTQLAVQAKELADKYHNVVIVPIFFFLAWMLLPITYFYGNFYEKTGTVFAVCIWFGLVLYDHKTGRISQQKWLKSQGIQF